jgi:hypothetical protein
MMIHQKLHPEKHRCDPWICLGICNPCCYTPERHTWWIEARVYGNCKDANLASRRNQRYGRLYNLEKHQEGYVRVCQMIGV